MATSQEQAAGHETEIESRQLSSVRSWRSTGGTAPSFGPVATASVNSTDSGADPQSCQLCDFGRCRSAARRAHVQLLSGLRAAEHGRGGRAGWGGGWGGPASWCLACSSAPPDDRTVSALAVTFMRRCPAPVTPTAPPGPVSTAHTMAGAGHLGD